VQEAAYLRGEGRASFERPYGLAWLLELVAELREWDDPEAREMAANLHPLEKVVLERLNNWLPKLSHPVRIGEHDQTAFALGLVFDYAHGNGDQKFAELVVSKAKQFYLNDKDCPLAYEPSGEDFLSPCLGEADLMRRVLLSQEFARWLRTFMPQISASGNLKWLQPVVSQPSMDVGGCRCWFTEERQAAAVDHGGCRGTQAGWFGGCDGRALRRRALAGELCSLPRHEAGHSAEVSGRGEARTACRYCSI
jgi:hypothetical protein